MRALSTRIVGTLCALVLLPGCGEPQPPREEMPRPTIVSLNPCADAILAEVAAPGQLLAISHYSHDPRASSMPAEQAALYPAISRSAEEVLALAPDVLVADPYLDPATRTALERGGIRIESVGMAADLEQSLAQVRDLAAIAAAPEAGEAMARRIARAWDEAAFAGRKVSTLVWQQGGIVPGRETLVAAMIEHTGFALQSAARGLGQGAYLPLEQVLADPPELVLAVGDERQLAHPALTDRAGIAYRYYDPTLNFCAGTTIPRALARLTAIRADFE